MKKDNLLEKLVAVMRKEPVNDGLERAIGIGTYNHGIAKFGLISNHSSSNISVPYGLVRDLYSACIAVRKSSLFNLENLNPQIFIGGVIRCGEYGRERAIYHFDSSDTEATIKAVRKRFGIISTYEILAAYARRFSPVEKLARVIGDADIETVEHYEASFFRGTGTRAVASFKFDEEISPGDLADDLQQALCALIDIGYLSSDLTPTVVYNRKDGTNTDGPFRITEQKPVLECTDTETGNHLFEIRRAGNQITIQPLIETIGGMVRADILLAAFRITYLKRETME